MTNKGFTLVELLVTVAVIGILAGMAISQYSVYRAKAYDTLAISALTNARNALEAFRADHVDSLDTVDLYINGTTTGSCAYKFDHGTNQSCSSYQEILPGFTPTEDVVIWISWQMGDTGYMIWSCHRKGSTYSSSGYGAIPIDFYYHSQQGELRPVENGTSYCAY